MVVRARGWQKLGVDPPEPGEDQKRDELRQAVGRILAELENARGAIERSASAQEWWLEPLRIEDWNTSADILTKAELDEAHKATRIAYRHIAELNQIAKETYEGAVQRLAEDGVHYPAGARPRANGNSTFWQAVSAIRQAEAALENAQSE